MLILAAVLMVIVCATIGNGKAGEVNKIEKLPTNANAAGVKSADGVIETDGLNIYGDVGFSEEDEIIATLTDASTEEEIVSIEAEVPEDDEVSKVVKNMTVEEKVSQLFIVTPEKLTGSANTASAPASSAMRARSRVEKSPGVPR